jgi:hypothetical protein
MTSSSDPHTTPASEPLRFTDAARLHARRFNKYPLASALRLLSADQRITHPDGGIALLTEAGHAVRATVLFVVTYVPTTAALIYGLATGNLSLVAVTAPLAGISALIFGSRCERQIRAHRTFDTTANPWVLSDVATEPHRGIGDSLVSEVIRRGRATHTVVVLRVSEDNHAAIDLYSRHAFVAISSSGHSTEMIRTPR